MTEQEKILREVWESGKNYSQVFDFDECLIRERWDKKLYELHKPVDRPKLREKILQAIGGFTGKVMASNQKLVMPTDEAIELADQILALLPQGEPPLLTERGSEYDANCGQMICCDILPEYVSKDKIEECYLQISSCVEEFAQEERNAQLESDCKYFRGERE